MGSRTVVEARTGQPQEEFAVYVVSEGARLESAGTLVGSASAADASNMKKLNFDGAAVSVNAGTTGGSAGARAHSI